jgi:hypothetical protein
LLVHCHFEIGNAMQLFPTYRRDGGSLQEAIALGTGFSLHQFTVPLSAQAELGDHRGVTMSSSVSRWKAGLGFDRPRNLKAVLDARTESAVWKAFRATAEKRFKYECVHFYEALRAFEAAPTLEAAKGLVDKYIRAGADEEVNISMPQKKAIVEALGNPNALGSNEALVRLFAQAKTEAVSLMTTNDWKPFLEAHSEV